MASTLSESIEKKEDREERDEVIIKRILVPIDGSNYSNRASKYAIEVSRLQKAQILCIHVISKLPYGYEYSGSATEQYFQDAMSQAQIWFKEIIHMAENKGIRDIKTDIFTDVLSITDAIINYALDNSIDLIVIGTKGKTGIERFLLGSVANGVIQHANCPVLLVR